MSEGSLAWRRVARGLCVIGVGLFLLANTSGRLPWSFWVELLPLWPVLLVAMGVRLVFERTRAPWLVLLAPALVLGTMTWVALGGPARMRLGGHTEPVRAERPAEARLWVLEANLAYGRLDLAGRVLDPSLLAEGEATVGRRPAGLRVIEGRESARVVLEGGARHQVLRLWNPWSRWQLDLAEDLPVALDLKLALADGRFDLSSLPLSSLDVGGAFNDLDVRLGRPEREVSVRLEGGFSSLRLRVPDGVPVRTESDGAFNQVQGERGGDAPGYRVKVDGAFNRVEVERP